MKSWSTQLCDKFFSSFFSQGAWKGDRKIPLTDLYIIYIGSLKKFHKESPDDEV